jgi:hypothetical protein
MKTKAATSLAFALLVTPLCAAAGAYDGGKPLLCALMEQIECLPGGQCARGVVEDINLPRFITIDLDKKLLLEKSEGEGGRNTPIDDQSLVEGNLVLQGNDKGRGWIVVVDSETGDLTGAIADDGAVFSVFGACTTP